MRKAGQEAQAFVACDASDPIPADMARREGVWVIRKGRLALSPRERLVEMQRLIDEAWALLEKNPAGKAHFLKRNFKARRIPSTQEPPANGT